MSGRSRVWTHAAYSSSSSLEIRIFRPSTSISLLSTQFGRAGQGGCGRKMDGEDKRRVINNLWMCWIIAMWSEEGQREKEVCVRACVKWIKYAFYTCVIINDVSLFMPTGYSARHVGRKVDWLLRLLLFFLVVLLLTLWEAAFLIQPKVVIRSEALQESAHCMTLSLDRKQDVTSAESRI